jgi:hypothetical protein
VANELTVPESTGDNTSEPADSETTTYVPEGFKSAEEFLKYARDNFAADTAYDRINREHALEDLEFLAGDQWDPEVKKARVDMNRPCLTINVLPQFVGQVVGDRRMNKTAIKVTPKKDASVKEAQLRSALIKGIEHESRAHRVYDACCEDQVACGISAFRVDLEYAANDVFDQNIRLRHIPNPLAVIWDRMSIDPTGKDAQHCFVQDVMPLSAYERIFPEHPNPDELGDAMKNSIDPGWFDKDFVRLTEFWELIEKPATFALMMDGDVKDVSGMALEEYEEELWRDRTGQPRIRDSYRTYARMHLITGFAILSDSAYEIPLTRLPIIKVEGRVVRVGEDRVRFGLVRYAKDSQRLKNYWRSVAAETLALAPKAQWVADWGSIEGREDDWRDAHISGDTLLIYNKGQNAPARINPPDVPSALLQEAQMNQQDIKDTTGLHDASLGIRSNEVSGRAIESRKAEGDTATVIYHDNLNESILEGGDVVNQLIPLAYDTVRQVLVIGEDDKEQMITINANQSDDDSPSISDTKYDVSLETGPSFATQRAENRDAMTTLIQTAPQLFAIAGDKIVEAMDWEGAHEIAERLRKQMEREGLIEPSEEDLTPEEQEQAMLQAQQAQQEQQMQQQMQQQMIEMEMQGKQLELAEQQARVRQMEAAARKAEADAMRAEIEAMASEMDAELAPLRDEHKMRLAERAASAKERQMSQRPTKENTNETQD